MKRLFFGLSVDADVGAALLRAVRGSLGGNGDGAGECAIYGADDLHVTLCFIGRFDPREIPSLRQVAGGEFRGMLAPEMRVGGETGAFPSRAAPRALFAQARESASCLGRLEALRNRALQAALAHGWRPGEAERGRSFRPHVTVARAPNGTEVPEDFWDIGLERSWVPVDVSLFESLGAEERESTGERYRIVASWPLAVRPG